MKREDLFTELEKIKDPKKDFNKILSNLHYTHFFLMDRYNKILSKYDLTTAQSNVLGIIGHFHPEPVSLEEIKSMILERSSDVSRIVSRLVEKKFAGKISNPNNRRKVSIGLTPSGYKLFNLISKDKKLRSFTSDLDLAESKTFFKVLSKLRKH